jgi:hypothetical protein
MWQKSKTDALLPNRASDLTLSALPIWQKFKTEAFAWIRAFPKADTPDPIRENERTLMALPTHA